MNPDQKVAVVMPVLIQHAWQRHMTECAVKTLRDTTGLPFDLILVQARDRPAGDFDWPLLGDDQWLLPERSSVNGETNEGFAVAEERGAEIIVYTGNDVMTRPGWLEALLEVFEKKPDAGVATLASADLKGKLPYEMPQDRIEEGVYGPFMAFRAGWRFDAETFPRHFGDSDLVMRAYREGLRSYRNFKVVIEHMNRQTVTSETDDQDLLAARDRFVRKHDGCGLLMFRLLVQGWVI